MISIQKDVPLPEKKPFGRGKSELRVAVENLKVNEVVITDEPKQRLYSIKSALQRENFIGSYEIRSYDEGKAGIWRVA